MIFGIEHIDVYHTGDEKQKRGLDYTIALFYVRKPAFQCPLSIRNYMEVSKNCNAKFN